MRITRNHPTAPVAETCRMRGSGAYDTDDPTVAAAAARLRHGHRRTPTSQKSISTHTAMQARSVGWMLTQLVFMACLHMQEAAGAGALGIDVGQANSVVAVARHGGVDVIANEATRRQTPSLVAFDERQRFMGEAAGGLRSSKPMSTVEVKSLISQNPTEEAGELCDQLLGKGFGKAEDGSAIVRVDYLGKQHEFTPVQLLAMFLLRLRLMAESDHGSPINEVVLAVPARYTAHERMSVLNAAELSGMRKVHLITDACAAALDYALSRRDVPADKGQITVFVDAGQAGVQISIIHVWPARLKLLAHAFAADCGGAAMDRLLLRHFASEIKARYNLDPLSSPRATQRLRGACEKLRRVLSANQEASFALDCLVDETDVHCALTRTQLEAMCAPLFGRVGEACASAVSRISAEIAIEVVELVGGCTRMPALAKQVERTFKLHPGRSLNAEETVARGAALASALHSKGFKSIAFEVDEGLLHAHALHWQPQPQQKRHKQRGPPAGQLRLRRGAPLPLHKRVTLRGVGGGLRVVCAQDERVAADAEPQGQGDDGADTAWEVEAADHALDGDLAFATDEVQTLLDVVAEAANRDEQRVLRVDLLIDTNQLPSLAIHQVEELEADASVGLAGKEADTQNSTSKSTTAELNPRAQESTDTSREQASEAAGDGKSVEGDASEAARTTDDPPQRRQTLRSVAVRSQRDLGLPESRMSAFRKAEEEMQSQDRQVERALASKNELEATIYSIRSELSEALAPFTTDEEGETMSTALELLEDWLYNEGEFETAIAYEEKSQQLSVQTKQLRQRSAQAAEARALLDSLEEEVGAADRELTAFEASGGAQAEQEQQQDIHIETEKQETEGDDEPDDDAHLHADVIDVSATEEANGEAGEMDEAREIDEADGDADSSARSTSASVSALDKEEAALALARSIDKARECLAKIQSSVDELRSFEEQVKWDQAFEAVSAAETMRLQLRAARDKLHRVCKE